MPKEPYEQFVPDPYVPERNVEFPKELDADTSLAVHPKNWERADKPEEPEEPEPEPKKATPPAVAATERDGALGRVEQSLAVVGFDAVIP